jgi:hypothetical protein
VNPNEMRNTERWLDCQVDEGMFSDELAVTYPPDGKIQKSVFVAKNDVRGTAGERGKVRVVVIRRDGNLIGVLPTTYPELVNVSASDVSAA